MSHNEQMKYFYEIFDSSLPRLGPGDEQSTRKALDVLISAGLKPKNNPGSDKLRILDIGCGNGPQTIELAKRLDGSILAVDNHQPFLDELQRRADAEGLSGKIQTRQCDMAKLEPTDGPFDLIWSEGAISLMGFQEGLAMCHSLLVSGGFLAVSELTWFKPNPPEECRQLFEKAFPRMQDIEANLATIHNCGFDLVGHFTLPESNWLESLYRPLEDRLQSLRQKYPADQARLGMINSIQMEIDIYRKYSSYYGYAFFVMRQGSE